MTERAREKIWTFLDEWGLLSGVDRIPGESLLDFRTRILNHEKYDSTGQGLTYHISDALLTTGYNTIGKKEFFSLRTPLSLAAYQAIAEPDAEYYAPRITVGSTTWTITPSADFEKDMATGQDVSWYLWKQPNGTYGRVWTTDTVPTGDVELRYQWMDDLGSLHTIYETSKILTWNEREIVEEYPPEIADA